MPPPMPTVSRKRTRSTHVSDSDDDSSQIRSTSTIDSSHSPSTTLPKRQRNNPSSASHTNYSLRHRSVTSEPAPIPSIDRSSNSQRYNLRPRTSQSQVRSSRGSIAHSTTISRRIRRQNPIAIPRITPPERPISPLPQARQYRFVYISDDDNQPTTNTPITQSSPMITNTTLNLITDDEDEEPRRTQIPTRRTVRSTTATR